MQVQLRLCGESGGTPHDKLPVQAWLLLCSPKNMAVTDTQTNAYTSYRPPSKEEVAARTPQVVKCDEAMKSVTLTQTLPNSKQHTTRTYHFDKVQFSMRSDEQNCRQSSDLVASRAFGGKNSNSLLPGDLGPWFAGVPPRHLPGEALQLRRLLHSGGGAGGL
jgi:hypothetical protein